MDFYKEYCDRIKELEKELIPYEKLESATPSQFLLYLKAAVIERFDGKKEKHFTFKADGKFGFSEILVNTLMQYAYWEGKKYNAFKFTWFSKKDRKLLNEAISETYHCWEGKKVYKHSLKPFKSKKYFNTVKSIIEHPITKHPAFTFLEDDSIVEVRACTLALKKE